MIDAFDLRDPLDAQALLGRVSRELRHKGEALFRAGRVHEIVTEAPGEAYSTRVEVQGMLCRVSLRHEAGAGWLGGCSCSRHSGCEHIYAAMCSLLAEYRTVVVRGLSASLRPAVPIPTSPPGPAAPEDTGHILEKLAAALGRPVTKQEWAFVQRVKASYVRCRQARRISEWDFAEMGLPLAAGLNWAPLEIWPSFPPTLLDFWLYVANAAVERGVHFPEFMESVTDLRAVQERITGWRRAREIQHWKQTLDRLGLAADTPAAADDGQFDLRLVIEPTTARLQVQRPGSKDFQTPGDTQFNRLWRQHEQGALPLTSGAELLWQLLSSGFYAQTMSEVRYEHHTAVTGAILGRILRAPLLESRIVTPAGRPLARPSEPLRWELLPAAGEQDDYRLHLVQANGTPAPKFYCSFQGRPTVYLAADAVFTGPAPLDLQIDARNEISIPAPAIESNPGVTFLQALRLEFPPRLRDRVRTLPFEVAIHCELQPRYASSNKEDCVLRVVAQASDGHQEAFNGRQWVDSTPRGATKRERQDPTITIYDRSALERVPALLDELNTKFDPGISQLVLRVTRKFPEQFAAWLKTVPPNILIKLEGELASFASADVAGRVRLDVTEAEIDWFDLRVVLDVSDTTLSPEETKLLLNAKGRYVRLDGKGWRRLQFDLTEEEDERLARLGLNPRELSAEPQRLHALQLADDAARKFLPEQQVEQIQRRASELKTRVTPSLPPGITAEFRPYQLEGFHFLAYLAANSFGGILADDMGLGKTVQGLAWLLWLRQQPGDVRKENSPPPAASGPLPSLVVCPKSVMDNWQAEAARFTPALRVKVWPAAKLHSFATGLDQADLHVLNYAQLRSLGETLAPLSWLAVILDEGQYIKNPSSHTARVARTLRTRNRLVLSGTPIENRLLDLWSLMNFAMPGLLGNRAQFAKLYDGKDDPFARRRLSARVRPFLLRRTKGQVAKDLPDRIEEDLFCEIEGEQKTLYRAELKRAQQMLLALQTQQELAKQQFNFLTSLLRLRQICCHPRLLDPHSKAASAKADALLEHLEPLMEDGEKVLVFSQFVALLDLLRPELEHRGWPVFYLSGQTEDRGELVREFQAAKGSGVFLISLKAGGFGLNLTAASYVVLFDPWWNPAVENQAIDRTHRIGQTSKVIAYRLLIKDSIEEKIRLLQQKKTALAEEILGEERFAQSLTLEDLRFLFAD
ncbi:MAG: DEAD/DEAH box helicase [Limisphaerales bacterium]